MGEAAVECLPYALCVNIQCLLTEHLFLLRKGLSVLEIELVISHQVQFVN